MKFQLLSFLAIVGTIAAQADSKKTEQCEKCVEELDEAKECLRICNDNTKSPISTNIADDGSLLNDCLDPSRDDGSIDSLDELIDCCQMTNNCKKELEDAQECVQLCFDPCIKETAQGYLSCIEDENKGIGEKCSRQACLDGFLNDLEEDADFSGDVLDLKNVQKRLEKIEQEDLEDCGLLADFVEAACDIGEECCDKCNPDLALVVDCLINDIVIPFTAIELNTTIDECIIEEQCALGKAPSLKERRRTTKEEEEIFSKALNLPKQSKRDPTWEAAIKKADKNRVLEEMKSSDELVADCERSLQLNTVTRNVTYAVNIFLECVTAAAISALPDTDEPQSAAPAFKLAIVVASMVGTLFAL